MSIPETIAVLLALLYLALASAQKAWCWPAGIASSLIYIYVCYSSNLLIESGLQVFYAGAGIWGWWKWKSEPDVSAFKPRNWSRKESFVFFMTCSMLSFGMGFLFSRYTNTAQPWLDAFLSVFSIGCTLLVVKKIIQNWPIWILIDLGAVYLYYERDLRLSALLYMLYCLMALMGWIRWKRAL